MLKAGKAILLLLLLLWELPQSFVGIIVLGVFHANGKIKSTERNKLCLFVQTRETGVSLGRFVFWTANANRYAHLNNDCKMHEYGHSLQSIMLGPMYLFVIGIPSVLRAAYSRYYFRKYHTHWRNYYNAFPENWADRLGGVTKPHQTRIS